MDLALQLGQTIGDRYLLQILIEKDQNRQTFWAEDLQRQQEACVVHLINDPAFTTDDWLAIQQKTDQLCRLVHPQLTTLQAVFLTLIENRQILAIVEEGVDGQSYRDLLNLRRIQGDNFTELEVIELLTQVLPVLAYLHENGVIHGSLTTNHLLRRDCDRIPVIVHWALAFLSLHPKEQNPSVTVLARSDLTAIASIILELLTGKTDYSTAIADSDAQQIAYSLHPPLSTLLSKLIDPPSALSIESFLSLLSSPASDSASKDKLPVISQASFVPQKKNKNAVTLLLTANPDSNTDSPNTSHPMSLSRFSSPSIYGFLGKVVLVLALMLGSGTFGWFMGKLWIYRSLNYQGTSDILQSPNSPPKTSSSVDTAANALSEEELNRKTALRTRQKEMGIKRSFFKSLVDQWSALSQPQTEKTEPQKNTTVQWDQTANELLDKLSFLSPEALNRLGQYTSLQRDRWKTEVNQLHLSSRALLDLANAQFFAHFPLLENQSIEETPAEQVWNATLWDTLKTLQTGNNYDRLVLPPQGETLQKEGTLETGQGKAMVIHLTAQQTLTLFLETNGNTQLSIYTPTGKTPILEDSTQTQWSGQLPETGFYELVFVSKSPTPISYHLKLNTNQPSAPDPTPSPSAP